MPMKIQLEKLQRRSQNPLKRPLLKLLLFFKLSAGESIESISENLANETLTPLVFINPGELAYTITISGPDAEFVEFDEETLTINLISALIMRLQTTLSFTVTIESENADVSEIEVLLDVTNIDEPIELTSTLLADSFAENH